MSEIREISLNGIVYDIDGQEQETGNIKQALLQLARKVAYIDENGQDYYDTLYTALYPPSNLASITAAYTQSGTVYDTDSLDDLKTDLVVTATYTNGTSRTIGSGYVLSGDLQEGTCVITVLYGGKTATFYTTVTEWMPDGFTKYDYIYQTGSSAGYYNRNYYIPAKATVGSDYTIDILMARPSQKGSGTPEYSPFFGTRNGDTENGYALYFGMNNGVIRLWANQNTYDSGEDFAFGGSINQIKILPVGKSETYPNNIVISINGTETNTGSTLTGYENTWGDWLGIFHSAASASVAQNYGYNRDLQIGRIRIYDSADVLVNDFIPCTYDGYCGFYDKIADTFYYNTTYGNNSSIYVAGNWSAT